MRTYDSYARKQVTGIYEYVRRTNFRILRDGDLKVIPNCPKHGAMLCYGQHGKIRLYRCETEYTCHLEIWIHDNGNSTEVKPHTLFKSKEGQDIIHKLESSLCSVGGN